MQSRQRRLIQSAWRSGGRERHRRHRRPYDRSGNPRGHAPRRRRRHPRPRLNIGTVYPGERRPHRWELHRGKSARRWIPYWSMWPPYQPLVPGARLRRAPSPGHKQQSNIRTHHRTSPGHQLAPLGLKGARLSRRKRRRRAVPPRQRTPVPRVKAPARRTLASRSSGFRASHRPSCSGRPRWPPRWRRSNGCSPDADPSAGRARGLAR